jgi:hypothetical protein
MATINVRICDDMNCADAWREAAGKTREEFLNSETAKRLIQIEGERAYKNAREMQGFWIIEQLKEAEIERAKRIELEENFKNENVKATSESDGDGHKSEQINLEMGRDNFVGSSWWYYNLWGY